MLNRDRRSCHPKPERRPRPALKPSRDTSWLRDYAFATGYVAPLAALSGPTCWFCGTELQVIDMSWRVGRGWEKTATTISSIELVAGQPPGPVELVVVYSCGESKVFDVKGGTIQVFPAATDQSGRLSLKPGESSYLVSDMQAIAPQL